MGGIRLNVGAGPIWEKNGWHTLDHKKSDYRDDQVIGDAADIPLEDGSCETIFTSHMFEHIPHTKLENILLELNRALRKDGILRVLTPDLKKIATAYVNDDNSFFKKAIDENVKIRTDLGLGGMFMNFVVSPGQDTALFDKSLSEFISGYAHLYLYDFQMLKILLTQFGFYDIKQKEFCDSEFDDYKEPLHVVGVEPVWENFNQALYDKHNLVHSYDEKTGKYDINFKITGFDRDPLTSLIIEAKKSNTIDKDKFVSLNENTSNYNRYGQSLKKSEAFNLKCELLKSISKTVDLNTELD